MKDTILVTCTTFPRWDKDSVPSFVDLLSRRLTKDYNVVILAPHSAGAKKYEEKNGMKIYRYKYFFEKKQKLGDDAIIPILKKDKFLYVQLGCLVISQFFNTLKVVKKENVKKIHAHWLIPQALIAKVVKKLYGTPYYIVSHGGDIFGARNLFFTWLKKLALKDATRVVGVSNVIKEGLLNLYSKSKVDVIPMGVDFTDFSPKNYSDELKEKHDVKGPMLMFVGRLSEKKGLNYLIDAMPTIVKEYPNIKLLIAGSGEDEHDLKEQTKKNGMENNIKFLGPVPHDELPSYYATADIFVGPSVIARGGDREGVPVTYMEAMASGTYLIGTDLEGNRDIIKHNDTGSMIKQRDPDAISDEVIKVLKNKEESDKIAKKGMEYVNQFFNWEYIGNKYCVHLSKNEKSLND